jgi:hypothetical protein
LLKLDKEEAEALLLLEDRKSQLDLRLPQDSLSKDLLLEICFNLQPIKLVAYNNNKYRISRTMNPQLIYKAYSNSKHQI